jgi:DNA-binding NtrC family response regulator
MAQTGNVRVLFVDDEADIVEAYAALLQAMYAWKVTCALSGKEALRHLRRQEFDVIVSDYRMPQMSGLDLLRKVKRVAPGTPFVMLTAYGDPDLEAHSIGAGAARFLGKSETPQAVAAAIQGILGGSATPPASKGKGPRRPTRQGQPRPPRGTGGNPQAGLAEPFRLRPAPAAPASPELPGPFGVETLRPDLDVWDVRP